MNVFFLALEGFASKFVHPVAGYQWITEIPAEFACSKQTGLWANFLGSFLVMFTLIH